MRRPLPRPSAATFAAAEAGLILASALLAGLLLRDVAGGGKPVASSPEVAAAANVAQDDDVIDGSFDAVAAAAFEEYTAKARTRRKGRGTMGHDHKQQSRSCRTGRDGERRPLAEPGTGLRP